MFYKNILLYFGLLINAPITYHLLFDCTTITNVSYYDAFVSL